MRKTKTAREAEASIRANFERAGRELNDRESDHTKAREMTRKAHQAAEAASAEEQKAFNELLIARERFHAASAELRKLL